VFTKGAGLVIEDCPDARSVHPFSVAELGVVVDSKVVESSRNRLRFRLLLSSGVPLVEDVVDRWSEDDAEGV